MNFSHSEFNGGKDDVVLVTLSTQANVMLLDDTSFLAYRDGRSFSYFGGWATESPVRLSLPHSGHWHVAVDLGGNSGTVRVSVRVVRLSST